MHNTKIIYLAPILFLHNASLASQTFNIHGEIFHCNDWSKITGAAAANNEPYFAGWTEEDFAMSKYLVRSCHRKGLYGDYATTEDRLAEIDRFQANMQVRVAAREEEKKRHQEAADQAAKRALEAKEREATDQTERARKTKVAQCRNSDEYALFLQQELVIDDRETIEFARNRLARERRIGEISGTVDMAIQHDAGVTIVEKTSDMKEDFREYRKLGGREVSPERVRHSLPNPCPE